MQLLKVMLPVVTPAPDIEQISSVVANPTKAMISKTFFSPIFFLTSMVA
jgi:hypothetical protein